MELKTSQQWHDILNEKYPNFFVMDPDGWDRKNYQFSWHEELITRDEFEKRLVTSTVRMPYDMIQNASDIWI
jgi:hypothetical protein